MYVYVNYVNVCYLNGNVLLSIKKIFRDDSFFSSFFFYLASLFLILQYRPVRFFERIAKSMRQRGSRR